MLNGKDIIYYLDNKETIDIIISFIDNKIIESCNNGRKNISITCSDIHNSFTSNILLNYSLMQFIKKIYKIESGITNFNILDYDINIENDIVIDINLNELKYDDKIKIINKLDSFDITNLLANYNNLYSIALNFYYYFLNEIIFEDSKEQNVDNSKIYNKNYIFNTELNDTQNIKVIELIKNLLKSNNFIIVDEENNNSISVKLNKE